MNAETERELNVVLAEEKAKIVLGEIEYETLPYMEWVEELKNFVLTQLCADCGATYDLDEPSEEIWAWFLEGENHELEVSEFFCANCFDRLEDERRVDHPKTWGTLLFRRRVTGTFPLNDEDG